MAAGSGRAVALPGPWCESRSLPAGVERSSGAPPPHCTYKSAADGLACPPPRVPDGSQRAPAHTVPGEKSWRGSAHFPGVDTEGWVFWCLGLGPRAVGGSDSAQTEWVLHAALALLRSGAMQWEWTARSHRQPHTHSSHPPPAPQGCAGDQPGLLTCAHATHTAGDVSRAHTPLARVLSGARAHRSPCRTYFRPQGATTVQGLGRPLPSGFRKYPKTHAWLHVDFLMLS